MAKMATWVCWRLSVQAVQAGSRAQLQRTCWSCRCLYKHHPGTATQALPDSHKAAAARTELATLTWWWSAGTRPGQPPTRTCTPSQQPDTLPCLFAAMLIPAVGDVPLVWYKDEDHIGYDVEGEKIQKKVGTAAHLPTSHPCSTYIQACTHMPPVLHLAMDLYP